MNIHPKTLKQEAAQLLQQTSPDYRQTVLLHSAVSLGILFLINLVSVFLNNAISDTGGLSDIGIRSILGTVQSTLMTAANIALPFWEAGILYTSMRVARQQQTRFSMLTQGFRRFGALLRFMILWMLISFAVAMVSINVLSIFAMFISLPPELEQAMAAVDMTAVTDPAEIYEMLPMDLMLQSMIPVVVVYLLLFFGVIIYFSYRFRLSQYLLLDETPIRARAALRLSNHLTNGHKKSLLMLDLSFWWYYLLQALITCLVYTPELISAMGISLPIPSDIFNVLSYGAYCVVSLILVYYAGAYVQTTNACAYEHLRSIPENI